MVNSPYFIKSKQGKPRLMRVANRLMVISIIGFIIFTITSIASLVKSEELFNMQIIEVLSEPENYDFTNFYLTDLQRYKLYAFVLLLGLIMASFVTSIAMAIIFYKHGQKSDGNIARTEEGNRLTELI